MMRSARTRRFSLIMLILFLALSSTFNYIRNYAYVCNDCEYLIAPRMNAILIGESEPPFSYRVLTPLIQAAIGNGMWTVFLFHFVGSALLLALCYAWVRRWNGNGLLAITLLFVLMQFSYMTWLDSDYALTESVLLLAGWLLLIRTRNDA